MTDFVTGLRQDLVEAAARQQRRSPAARATRPLRPRAWSPVAVLGAVAALAAVVVLVIGFREIAPPRQPEAPKVVGTYQLGGQPRDAVAAGGALMIADLSGRVVRVSPGNPSERQSFAVGAAPQSIAADGDAVWVVGSQVSPDRSLLVQHDARTGRRLARISLDGYRSFVGVGAGGVWVADLHPGGITRINPRTGKDTAFIRTEVRGLAVTDRSVWVHAGDTVTQWDANGLLVNRVGGISPSLGDESQRTLLPDANGAWVVGQSDGLLYRIEGGRVVRRIAVGETAGVIAGSGSTVWVSASPGVDREELVRVDADDGKVTGRVSLGRYTPQAIVPIGKDVWVVTGVGGLLRIRPE